MDCNASSMEPYPQYYAYQLLASSSYLGLEEGGRMAASGRALNDTIGIDGDCVLHREERRNCDHQSDGHQLYPGHNRSEE